MSDESPRPASDERLAEAAAAGNLGGHDGSTKAGIEGSALQAAAAQLRASLCPDGGHAEADEWDLPGKQWSLLRAWAQERAMILAKPFPGPERVGGREHDLRFDATTGRWWKFTKPNLAGYTVDWRGDGTPYMLNASPLEYLERLILQNELFADDIEFAGLCPLGSRAWSIVTTQADVAGRAATEEEILVGMEALGFELLPWRGLGYENSFSFRLRDFAVWDVHPANVVTTPEGTLVPVDVIVSKLPQGSKPNHP